MIINQDTYEITVSPIGAAGSDGAPGVGIPTGGATGEVLAKVDGDDYNTRWVAPSVGTATWGFIVGTIGDQADLQALFDGKADTAHTHTIAQITDFPALATVATTGAYGDLTGVPTLGTASAAAATDFATAAQGTSADAAFAWGDHALAGYALSSALATVATTGSYTDLIGTPAFATVATTGAYTDLIGTPTLATVATTGSYTDLTNLPTLGTAAATDAADYAITARGLPVGGVTGQALVKVSGADYDVTWVTVGTGGGSVSWGGILGTLSDQTDLQAALDLKANTAALATVATSGAYADLTGAPVLATVATTGAYSDLSGLPTLGTAAASDAVDFATAAQGTNADAAFGWGDHALVGYALTASLAAVATTGSYADLIGAPVLATVATSGDYNDLSNLPTLGTAAASDATDFATAAQGALADTAVQDGDTLAGGFVATVDDDGTITTGTYTPDVTTGGNYKRIGNGGAFSIAPPSVAVGQATTVSILMQNNGSAGAVSLAAFDVIAGDTITNGNGQSFFIRAEVFNDAALGVVSSVSVQAI